MNRFFLFAFLFGFTGFISAQENEVKQPMGSKKNKNQDVWTSSPLQKYYEPLDRAGWSLSAEYLYWKVFQQASTYALKPSFSLPTDAVHNSGDLYGKYQATPFDWNSGVRACLSYTFARDAWELLGQYTYYTTNGSTKASRNNEPTSYLFGTHRVLTTGQLQTAKSSTHFSYQIADFVLGRRFLVSEQMFLQLYAGAKGAWIGENWKITYQNTDGVVDRFSNRWTFGGAGIQAGFDGLWHIGKGVSFFNQISAATVIGNYRYRTAESYIVPVTEQIIALDAVPLAGNINPLTKASSSESLVLPMTQLAFGIDWSRMFSKYRLHLRSAFEIATWYDLHQVFLPNLVVEPLSLPDRIAIRDSSNVNIYGLSVRAGVDF